MATKKNHKWATIIIEDKNSLSQIGLHLELTIAELKKLAFYIADKYLDAVKPAPTPVS